MSLLASVAFAVPITIPVDESGLPTNEIPLTGSEFADPTATLMRTVAVPPFPSLMVTMKLSVVSTWVAPSLAAAWRDAAEGA